MSFANVLFFGSNKIDVQKGSNEVCVLSKVKTGCFCISLEVLTGATKVQCTYLSMHTASLHAR